MGHTLKGFHSALCVTALFAVAAPAAQAAELDEKFAFDIPSQSLEGALLTLSKQAQFQLIVSDALPTHLTQRINGRMPIKRALEMLIKDTKLGYKVVGERTLAVLPENVQSTSMREEVSDAEQGGLDKSGTENKKWTQLLMAQTEGAAPTTDERGSPASGEELGGLEEIVVTAQRREENLRDVPMSISVLSGDQLDRSTFEGVEEALASVPGVTALEQGQGAGTQLSIRGVSSGYAGFYGTGTVAYYIDSTPFSMYSGAVVPDTSAYDLERVEVLRGPQGTLYGDTGLGGVIRILSAAPNLDEFEFKTRATVSSTEHGDPTYRGDAALNLALVPGQLAARLVLGYEERGGWIDKPIREDTNDAELENARLRVLAHPTDALSVGVSYWRSREENHSSTGDEPYSSTSLVEEPNEAGFDSYSLAGEYDFGGVTLSSATSFLEYTQFSQLDFTGLGAPAVLYGPITTYYEVDIFSQEVSLASIGGGSWRWNVGALYRDLEERGLQYFPGLSARPPLAPPNKSESLAVFGEVTRLLSDALELTVGGRYFQDDVTTTTGVSGTFDAFSPRVVLTWHPDDQLLVYASYSQGFRSGIPGSGPQVSVEPDTLTSYEVGSKGTFFDGRLQLEAAVYYVDWQDVHDNIVIDRGQGPVGGIVNGESASGLGVDFAASVRPTDGLTFGLTASWNDLTMDEAIYSLNAGVSPPVPVLSRDAGERFNYSPEYTLGISGAYEFPLGSSGLQGRIGASANYSSEQIFSTTFFGTRFFTIGDEIVTARASASVASEDGWRASLFVDNLTNQQGPVVLAPLTVDNWTPRLRPRTVGIQVEYHFGK